MKDHKPHNEIVKAYASKYKISIESAKKRLDAKYQEEVNNVDAKEIALKCIKSIRTLAPRVHGVELRETDLNHALKEAKRDADQANRRCEDLENKIEMLTKIIRQSVDTINNIHRETEEKMRVSKEKQIEYKKPSLYERICQNLILVLKKLKS